MDYALLFGKLEQHKVRYLICGGLAVNLHGVPRMTADIDIILNLTRENILSFEKSISELRYKLNIPVKLEDMTEEKIRRELKETKNLIALSFYNFDKNFLTLDVLIDFPIPFNQLWENKIIRKEGNLNVNIVSIDHLIKMKEYSNRIQDQQDVFYLSKIKHGK